MTKLTTTLVYAFAVLAFAAPALAENEERACGEVEKGTWTFDSEAEMNEFLEDLAAEAAENCTSEEVEDEWMIDACWAVGPIAHSVSTLRGEIWTSTTDIDWNPVSGNYEISVGGLPDPDMFEHVDELRVTWRHPGGVACLYCYSGSPWKTRHMEGSWTNDDYQSCSSLFGVYYYYGREWTYYDDDGVNYQVARFYSNPGGSGVFSTIVLVYP
jgi:hypothetical protein